ncbi:type II secretion system protein GspM [Marinobacterium aestuariivivens]|uniref:Type II secretion system protein GspM n=1 Tax=Marinobacterium aestuariivivens TaxID=1698799 RepID=A0ABW1ZU03_9GAMM
MKPMSPQRSRLLAVGLLIIAVLLLILYVIQPLVGSFLAYGERIETLENQLAIYRRLAEGLEADEARLVQLQAANPVTDLYLPESKPALAAAHLQQYLHQLVGRNGGQVISTQILSREEEGPLQAISIQVHMRGELEDLVDLFYNIESGKPALFAENVTVLANPRRQTRVSRRNNRRVQVQSVPALDIRFDLTGYAGKEQVP